MIFLRQSTASQEVPLGRFVDSTDGNTEETGLTIANTDIKIWKHGATSLANKNSGGATHMANGEYYCVLDATDTDTVGSLKITVHVSGALYVQVFCHVLEEAVYDALFAASAPGYVANAPVNVAQFGGTNGTFSGGRPEVNASHISGDSVAADNLEALLDGTGGVTLVASAFTLTTPITANATQISGDATAADNAEAFFDGTGYAGTNNVIPTVTTLTNLPAITANWLTAAGLAADAVAEIADAVWDEDATAHQTQGTFGQAIGDPGADTDSIWALANTNLDATVSSRLASASISLSGGAVTVGTNNDKTGYALSAAGVDDIWDEATSGHATAGTTGKALTDILEDTGTTLDGRIPAALVGGRIDATVDATGMETGAIDAILTRAMTEAYAADGATFTVAQALYMIYALLAEASASGTTLTIKKLDGSTTAMTFTLNDASTPTSITRSG